MIKCLKFISIPVADAQRARDFYTQIVGFTLLEEQLMGPGRYWIELGIPGAETRVVLFTPEGHESRIGSFLNASFQCDDVAATCDELTARGARFEGPPERQPWGTFAKLIDTEGNILLLSSG